MIWIISLVLMISFILSGIFIGFAPPVQSIVEKDFLRRGYSYAQLEGLKYGDVCLRAKTMDPANSNPNSTERRRVIQGDLFIASAGTKTTVQKKVYSDIKISPSPVNINVTASLGQPKPPAPDPSSLLLAPETPSN